MEIVEVRELLREKAVECGSPLAALWFGVMRMDNSRMMAACLFAKRIEPQLTVGGDSTRGVVMRAFSLRLRLGVEAVESRRMAERIYDGVKRIAFDGGFIRAESGCAVCVGSDGDGVFEYVIDFEVFADS